MSRKIYVRPEIEITEFETEDVITESIVTEPSETTPVVPETPLMPFG